MSRYTLVLRMEDGKPVWYEKSKAPPLASHSRSTQVMGDIEPFRSVVDGKVVSSRSALREHNKRNQVIDVGNDPALYRKPKAPPVDIEGIADAAKAAMRQHGIDYL